MKEGILTVEGITFLRAEITALLSARTKVVAIAKIDFQSTRCSNYELPAFLMGVCSTIFTRRYIIDVENTLYREWHLHILVDICKASAWVFFLRKLYYLAVG